MFNQDLREEVIERLGMLEPTSLEIINKVANSLSKNLDTGGKAHDETRVVGSEWWPIC